MAITVKELYEEITSQMSAEQALKKLLEGHVINYEKLKFNEGEEIHPIMLVSMAALDLGWEIAIPQGDDDEDVEGMVLGTEKYFDSVFGDDDCCGTGGCAGCGDHDNTGVDIDDDDFVSEQLNHE